MGHFPDWSALPRDLLEFVASSYCSTIEDFMAFRGVCTSWRAAATKDRFVAVSKVPLLMLAEREGSDDREFYSLSKRKIFTRIPLPGAKGKRCSDVGFGWILTKASTGEVCLMKPFSSSAVFQLPNFKEYPNYRKYKKNPEDSFIRRAWLTANPSETSDFTLLIDGSNHFGLWKNGDKNWTERGNDGGELLTFWKGKVYVWTLDRRLWVWDSHYLSRSDVQLVVPFKNGPKHFGGFYHHHLVGSSDGEQLLIISRNNGSGHEYADIGANHFYVRRVDLVRGRCVRINGLGKDAAFIGDNAAVCVDATEFPGILKPNCIYFTDDRVGTYPHCTKWRKGGGKDMGIYHIEDESIERFDVESYSFVCPPMWVFPSF